MKTLLNLFIISGIVISFSACSDDKLLNELQTQSTHQEVSLRPDGLVDGNKAEVEITNPYLTNKPDGYQDPNIAEKIPGNASSAKPDGTGRDDIVEMDTENDATLRSNGDTHPGKKNKKPVTPSKK